MNLVQSVKLYVDKMIDIASHGMKVFIMDEETQGIISLAYSMSGVFQKEVYLFERIDSKRDEVMKHLKCICILRPTEENIGKLCEELKNPHYGLYYIFFTNSLKKEQLKELAVADQQEVVREVQEFYADYYPISSVLFSMEIYNCAQGYRWVDAKLRRVVQGLTAMLLSVRKCPLVRYQSSSEMARRLAEGIREVMSRDAQLFDVGQSLAAPLLLILDRREDPITPLLNQWYYQAMIHELVGLKRNMIAFNYKPDRNGEPVEFKNELSHDEYFLQHMYENYAAVTRAINEDLKVTAAQHDQFKQTAATVDDLRSFVENLPQLRKTKGLVTKHFTIIEHLHNEVNKRQLMRFSELEQTMTCQHEHGPMLSAIKELVQDPALGIDDKVRLVMIYALRYENHSNSALNSLIAMLKQHGASPERLQNINNLLQYGGSNARTLDLFGESPKERLKKILASGLKDVNSVYTQHKPLLHSLLKKIKDGNLSNAKFPYIGSVVPKDRPRDVIVFIIGGATFEEAHTVYQVQKHSELNVVLGGTCIHNMQSFLSEVTNCVMPAPGGQRAAPRQ